MQMQKMWLCVDGKNEGAKIVPQM